MSNHVKELLSEYMDDEMDGMDKQVIEKHLAICAECHNSLQELMSLRQQMIDAYIQIEMPIMIEEKVFEKIHQASIKKNAGVINRMAIIILSLFGIMFLVMTSSFITVELALFHSVYSIARGLIYAIPSIISAIPYVVEVITVFIISFIALAILTLRYLVQTI